jgi:molecular chaperone DnaK
MGLSVGIDLGSTFSVISHVNAEGVAEVIPNCEGDRITPSVFAIDESGNNLVGSLAVEYETTNAKNIVRLVKRQMSKGFDKTYVFDESIQMSPIEISSEILKKLKRDAEDYLGDNITEAVITVPAYFNNDQRVATKTAGELAGLKVLRIINEPTAAALAYGLDKKNESKILVYDLGGGTFDVTILNLSDGCDFHVLSTSGNTNLGGADFDKSLAKLILNKFNSQYDYNYNQHSLEMLDESQLARLLTAAEKAKKTLSQLEKITVNISNFAFRNRQPVNLSVVVTREEFENSLEIPLNKTKDCIMQAILDSDLSFSEINEVVFVGGSTRIPYVFKKVQEWTGKKPNKSINPDEAVSLGAAIQASVLSGKSDKNIFLLDVTPLSLGIETQGGVMNVMIKRNSQVPTKFEEIFTTAEDNQTSVDVKVFQGERPQTKHNHYLGEFKLENIPSMRRSIPKIDVVFEVDADGIVTVKAVDEQSKNEKVMVLSGSLSNEDMTRMLQDAEENKISDERFKQLSLLRDWLTSLKIQLLELLDTKVLKSDDIKELEDLRISIESDYHSENIELLSSLVESGKEVVDNMSTKVHNHAKSLIQK